MSLRVWDRKELESPIALNDIRHLDKQGINTIVFIIPWYMAHKNSDNFMPGRLTPTDASLLKATAYAKSLGMYVAYKPHVDIMDESWRGEINPTSKAKWFSHYKAFLRHYIRFASKTQVDLFVIGTELDSMSSDTAQWRALIRYLRSNYHGKITYASSYIEQAATIKFWDQLDYIGINAYSPLTIRKDRPPDTDELMEAWHYFKDASGNIHTYVSSVETLSKRFQKPVLFTEIGYRSALHTAEAPGNWEKDAGPPSQIMQRDAYRAAYQTWTKYPWLKGFLWWDWHPGAFNPNDTDYSPKGKEAEQLLNLGR
jgi:hypothetical protein